MIQYYKNITSWEGTKARFTRDYIERYSRAGKRDFQRQTKVIGLENLLSSLHASAAHSNQQQKVSILQAPKFGHAGPGLSKCHPTSTYKKQDGVQNGMQVYWNMINANSMQLYNHPSVCVNG